MFGFFKRRRVLDDNEKGCLVEAISTMLEVQLAVAGGRSAEDAAGNINPRALGYIYGFVDAALRTIGHDMADPATGIPVTFHVLRRVFPGREEKYCQYLAERMGTDQVVTLAAVAGGQQYIDFSSGKLRAPMGLARYILDQE